MNRRGWHRLAYVIGILACIIPMWWLGQPKTTTLPGGVLAQLQEEHGLAQSSLGDIDPASETMKLVTLGFRGLASQLLWNQAIEAKKEENWTQLTATLDQLSKLQPNYITFWKFQSWNISYNVSVQFDDYRDRYYYVREGIRFLEDGIKHNEENAEIPQLLWDLGWFLGQKIGRADEYVQYRRLFKADDEYHQDRSLVDRDNWLVGKEWYLKAVDAIDNRRKSLGKKSPKIVYSSPAKSQMNYAEAIEEEGNFDLGQPAWVKSEEEWVEFGEYPIQHSTGVILYLGREAEVADSVERLQQELDDLRPEAREDLLDQRREQLSDAEREALDIEPAARTPQQAEVAFQAEGKLLISDGDIAAEIAKQQPDDKVTAFDLATRLQEQRTRLIFTKRYKNDANFDYWLVRSQFEQTPAAVAARRYMFDANQARKSGQRNESRELYEAGFIKWREVLEEFPVLMDEDGTTGDDILVFVEDYRRVLDSLDETIPESFPLWDVIEKFDLEQKFQEELREHQRTVAAGQDSADTPDEAENGEPEAPADADADSEDDATDPEQGASPGDPASADSGDDDASSEGASTDGDSAADASPGEEAAPGDAPADGSDEPSAEADDSTAGATDPPSDESPK